MEDESASNRYLSRRDAIKYALLGSMGALVAGSGASSLGAFSTSSETDPKAVLLSPPGNVEQIVNGLKTFQNGPITIGTIRGKSLSSFPNKITWVIDSDTGDAGVAAIFLADAVNPDFSAGPGSGALVFQGGASVVLPGAIRIALSGSGLDDSHIGVSGGNDSTFSSEDWQGDRHENFRIGTSDASTVPNASAKPFPDYATGAMFLTANDRLGVRSKNPGVGVAPVLREMMRVSDFSGGLPAQVGLPTGVAGTSGTYSPELHRHLFTGRFLYSATEFNALLPGGAFPDKFNRLKIFNSWTLRRIWAFTKTGPTGGTETYGVVNAAGVLQGTAVTIPASAGAISEAETTLQTTNLIGNTLYYLAQTASTAIVASTNVEVGIEYTMNV